MKLFLSIIFLAIFTIQDDFTFVKNNQKIVLKVDDGKRNLTWEQKSILHLKIENIDPQKLNMSAPGIRFIKSDNPKEEINLEITPKRDLIENDTLNLNVGFKNSNNDYIHHRFVILIKK